MEPVHVPSEAVHVHVREKCGWNRGRERARVRVRVRRGRDGKGRALLVRSCRRADARPSRRTALERGRADAGKWTRETGRVRSFAFPGRRRPSASEGRMAARRDGVAPPRFALHFRPATQAHSPAETAVPRRRRPSASEGRMAARRDGVAPPCFALHFRPATQAHSPAETAVPGRRRPSASEGRMAARRDGVAPPLSLPPRHPSPFAPPCFALHFRPATQAHSPAETAVPGLGESPHRAKGAEKRGGDAASTALREVSDRSDRPDPTDLESSTKLIRNLKFEIRNLALRKPCCQTAAEIDKVFDKDRDKAAFRH
jgi:hypothetical protein